tara:strand:- start:431 stop:1369 length:939 start_codon:yes stop_codon:yes gene_type:complete
MNILITGGCGYVGTVLVPKLLSQDHKVTVIDTQWFGNYLNENNQLKIIRADIRHIDDVSLDEFEIIIHLANIANDPTVELDPVLSWEVNCLATQQLLDRAARANVRQFIYASSGSVYGIKDEEHVTEDLSLLPISIYNKTKMVAERIVLSYSDKIKTHIIRPATVCGYSPRMRLDVSVNMLSMQALEKKKITVLGGQQTRPNIHIQDMIRVYEHFISNPDIENGCYNAGFENISIMDIAKLVSDKIPCEIIVKESNDNRSYRQNSDKITSTGFDQKFFVEDAIKEIIEFYENGILTDKEEFYNIRMMKKLFS